MDDSTTPLWLQVPEPSDLVKAFWSAVDVPAFGGRLEVNWAPGARVTSVGGLVYFATFLNAIGGVWSGGIAESAAAMVDDTSSHLPKMAEPVGTGPTKAMKNGPFRISA